MDAAWVAAIFGLVGVVIGGLLNAGTTAWSEVRRRRNATRSACRLVQGELRLIGAYIASTRGAGVYGPEAEEGLPVEQWKLQSATLAAGLNNDLWACVASAYGHVERLEVMLRMTPSPPLKGREVSAQMTEVYATVLSAVSEADDRLKSFHSG